MDRKQIGVILRARRKQLKKSQEEVALEAHFTRRQYYTEIETASTNYSMDSYLTVCKVLKLNYDLTPIAGSPSLPGNEVYDFKGIMPAKDEEDPKKKKTKGYQTVKLA